MEGRRTSSGRLLGIAGRAKPSADMQTVAASRIEASGLAGESRPGTKRQITVLAAEDWAEACAVVGEDLPWITRRANLLVEGMALAETVGRRLRVGEALLEVTAETDPCERMEQFCRGLRAALEPGWRGGASCRVVETGAIRVGDPVAFED